MEKRDLSNSTIVKAILTKKFNQLVFLLSVFIFILTYFVFYKVEDISVFPSEHFYYGAYNDSANNGNSKILSQNITDSVAQIYFELKEGFMNPYVGINIKPKEQFVVDITMYNKLLIDVKSSKDNSVGLYIFSQDTSKKNGINLNYYYSLPLKQKKGQYEIDLDKFKVPDWWMVNLKLNSEEVEEKTLEFFTSINVASDYYSLIDQKNTLEIYSFVFFRDNKKLFVLFSILLMIELAVFFLIEYLKKRKAKKKVVVSYKPVEHNVENKGFKDCIQYINNHYNESELTLEQVAKNSGLSPRLVANKIQKEFDCNFKTYINQIRITESKRLLTETNLNIGEIAFKVGFNNQSHFNRVFKSFEGKNPTEFRLNG